MDSLLKIEANTIKELKQNKYFKFERDRLKSRFFAFTNYPIINEVDLPLNEGIKLINLDFISRYHRMQGDNVLFPTGYNNFDLSIIDSASRLGHHIASYTDEYVPRYQKQIERMEISNNPDKTFKYSNKECQKFIQSIFIQLYQQGYIKRKIDYLVCDREKIYQKNEYYELDGKYFSIDNQLLSAYKKIVFVLELKHFKKELITKLKKLAPDKLKSLGYSEGLSIDFNLTNGNLITLDILQPQTLFGISYIVLNPNYLDIKPYIDENEVSNPSLKLMYSGVEVINHFSNKHIPIFIGNYFNEAIHLGIPSLNEEDELIANSFDLPYLPIYDYLNNDKILVNSRFLNGYTDEEARVKIIDLLTKNGSARYYDYFDLEEIVVSCPYSFGVPIPITYDGEIVEEPILYNLKLEGRFTEGTKFDRKLVKDFINPYFVECFIPYLAIHLDEAGIDENNIFSKIDLVYLNQNNHHLLFQYVLGSLIIRNIKDSQYDIDKVFFYKNNVVDCADKMSHLLDKEGSSLIRIAAILCDDENFGKAIDEAKKIIIDISNLAILDFCENGLDNEFYLLKNKLNKYAKDYDFRTYLLELIEYIKKVHKAKCLPYVQLKVLIIYLSILTPALAEDLKKRLLKFPIELAYCGFPE